MTKVDFSVVVNFHNMHREAKRTLHSLTRSYQNLDDSFEYEVIAIDNNSTFPLEKDTVEAFGPQFRLKSVTSDTPSPCKAINDAIKDSASEWVMILIDGARLLSPGIINTALNAAKSCQNPFIYTLGMHIGPEAQNYLVEKGYNQEEEDQLIATTNWENDGYQLFDISSVALSSKKGFFSELTESNCIMLRKSDFLSLGGFEEGFVSPGGGFCNLELFNRLNRADYLQPIMLLGEATFHQFHGGTATNVTMKNHPWRQMRQEYYEIFGEQFEPYWRSPLYFGKFQPLASHLYSSGSS